MNAFIICLLFCSVIAAPFQETEEIVVNPTSNEEIKVFINNSPKAEIASTPDPNIEQTIVDISLSNEVIKAITLDESPNEETSLTAPDTRKNVLDVLADTGIGAGLINTGLNLVSAYAQITSSVISLWLGILSSSISLGTSFIIKFPFFPF